MSKYGKLKFQHFWTACARPRMWMSERNVSGMIL